MAIHRIVLAATGILGNLFAAALAQPEGLPQTQMAAAAVVMGQVVLATWYDADIQIIDDKTALLRGVLPGTGRNLSDVAVLKIDDCRFEAASSGSAGNKLAMINIGVLSDEYRQWRDNITGRLRTAIIGNGKGAAICSSVGNRLLQ